MESNSTMTSSTVETTCAHARVWRDRLQPGTRLLADLVIPVQGTTLPIAGKAGVVGRVTVQGIAPAFVASAQDAPIYNFMDVTPFRSGRPPV
jgi:hypothetical protein